MIMARARRGFTLVELVIVLAVISLIAGMAVPRYASASARYRVKAAARRVAADLEMARRLARANSGPVQVRFTAGVKSAYLVVLGDQETLPASIDDESEGVVSSVIVTSDPYRVQLKDPSFGGSSRVVFSGYGTASDGSVTLLANGWSAKVQLNGQTGVCTVVGP